VRLWDFSTDQVQVIETRYAQGHRIPPHCHDRAGLTLLLAGSISESTGRRTQAANALGYLFKREGVEHEDRIGGAGAHELQLWIEPSWLEDGVTGQRLDSWAVGSSTPIIRSMLHLFGRTSGQGPPPGELDLMVADLIAALGSERGAPGPPPEWLRQVVEEIEDDPSSGNLTGRLAAARRMHPVYLARTFRRFYGETVTNRVHRVRASRAAERIARGRDSFAMIAAASGFADQAHLNRVFRRVTGLSPGEYRRVVGGAG
jgi:AraC family transcriptional regulator